MPEVFADTGYWIALIDHRDQGHNQARRLTEGMANQQIITTEMILTELLNFASRQGQNLRILAGETSRQLCREPNVEVIPQTSGQFQQALERYISRPDQGWSLVDCASFIVMEERRIREALAFDHYFEQAGFRALLRENE
ncbi:MAG: PIN domain-containing protein [Chloroflexota bacterium]|nr:PIN domain-containing protein [Chloroflexota bacterium]